MTMKRDLKRVFRAHGIKVFALPVFVLLLLAVVADQRLGNYLEHQEEAAELQAQLESNREILSLDSKIQRKLEELTPAYSMLAPQIHTAPDIATSVQAMQEHLRQLLQSLYFGDVEFFDFSDTPQGSVTRLVMRARFTGVPQQLPRLEAALNQSPTIAAIDQLEIRVVDDPQRSGQQLAVTARFVGLHMKPLPEPVTANASKKTEATP